MQEILKICENYRIYPVDFILFHEIYAFSSQISQNPLREKKTYGILQARSIAILTGIICVFVLYKESEGRVLRDRYAFFR